mgnify:CR=1 FL=1
MPARLNVKDDVITAFLSGEIDHHTAKKIRDEIDNAVECNRPTTLVLDFGEVGFMDSSGIGLVMGRFKVMQEIGGSVVVQNPSIHIKKVMRLAGLDRIANIQDSRKSV